MPEDFVSGETRPVVETANEIARGLRPNLVAPNAAHSRIPSCATSTNSRLGWDTEHVVRVLEFALLVFTLGTNGTGPSWTWAPLHSRFRGHPMNPEMG